MKNQNYLLLVTLLIFLTSQTILAKSHRHRNNGNDGGRRNRNGQRNGRNRNNNEQGFSCPEMACPPVNPNCKNVEYLVLQFVESEATSDLVFECRGCDYCIDFRSLQKRAIRRHHDVHAKMRSRFQCPGVRFGCIDVRSVNVFITGFHGQSWSCPACFDHVLTNNN